MTEVSVPLSSLDAGRTAPRRRLTAWTLGVVGVAFLAGLLFGYDQGVISGALPILTADLGLSTLQAEVITSWVTLGAHFGALAAGTVADWAGRRRAAIVAGVLFTLGAIMEAFARGASVLKVGLSSPASASASARW